MSRCVGAFKVCGLAVVVAVAHSLGAWGAPAETMEGGGYTAVVTSPGRVSVTLLDGASVLTNAVPLVVLDGEDAPRVLESEEGDWGRFTERDALGDAEGVRVGSNGYAWTVCAYPGKPFITARLTFINDGVDPVFVSALMPFAADRSSGGSYTLGRGTNRAAILDNGTLTNPMTSLLDSDVSRVTSLWNVAAFNSETGRSVVAGFLTSERAYVQMRVERDEDRDAESFSSFVAECLYDPPVELQPGERIESEVFYLAVAEADPFDGLERFATSLAAFNALEPARGALPHGWDSWSTKYHHDITEEGMLASLDFVDAHLKRYGWTHFSIDDGWQRGAGDWQADPEKFPHGMKWFAEEIHKRGMTAGLWTEPFTVRIDSPLAAEHPDWLAGPNVMGQAMLGDGERILDITAPGAYEHVVALYNAIRGDWGYDALVEIDFTYHLLLADAYAERGVTRVEALRKGLTAIREGFGKDGFIMGVPPLPIGGTIVDGMRIGTDCAPIWRSTPRRWENGCVETLTNAARRYYFSSRVFMMDQDCAFFGHAATRERWKVTDFPELTWDQSVAWLTGAALTGGIVKIGDDFADLTEEQTEVLTRLLPVTSLPARPIDLFERDEPCIWVLPIDCAIGRWHVVGVFNWDETSARTLSLDLVEMGLRPNTQYAVYDYWNNQYVGKKEDSFVIEVPPGSVRLLSLRPYVNRPMFLSTDRHITQGATDFTALEWNEEEQVLKGAFAGVADTDYHLAFLAPVDGSAQTVDVSVGPVQVVRDGELLTVSFHCEEQGPVAWSVKVTKTL